METLKILLEITVYSAILYCGILLVKKTLGRKMSPVLHYAIWFLLVARLVLPFTIESGVAFFTYEKPAQQAATHLLQETQQSQNSAQQPGEPDQQGTLLSPAPVALETVTQQTGSATQTHTLPEIRPETVLLLIWLAGAAASFTILLTLDRRMRKRFRENTLQPSAPLLHLLENCKTELGVKSNIRVIGQFALQTPALMFPCTILLPADVLGSMDEEQIRMALSHELTHYKRGDHIVTLALLILRSLYWFNPVVWLLERHMREDMETACDNVVVRKLGRQGRNAYANTVLSMFARGSRTPFVIGMALSDNKKTAEKRIRGIYMRNSSKKSVKVVSVIVAAVLFAVCFTTACQPTPETPIVVNKSEGIQEEKISATATPVNYEVPTRWQEDAATVDSAEKFTINVDAEVKTLDRDNYPVYKIDPQATPSQKQFDKLVDAFFGDAPLFEPTGPSREQLTDWILACKEEIANMESGNYDFGIYDDYDGSEESKQRIIGYNRENLAELENQLAQTPETPAQVPMSTDISSGSVHGMADLGNSEFATLDAFFESEYTSVYFNNPAGFDSGGVHPMSWETELPLPGLERVTQAEAEAMAREFMDKGGFEGYALTQTAIMQQHTGSEGSDQDGNPYAFGFEFAKNIDDGIFVSTPALWTNPQAAEGTDAYSNFSRGENVRVYVNDNGYVGFYWDTPYEIVEVLNKNVELLPFEEIEERAYQALLNAYRWSADQEGEAEDWERISESITIENIQLKYVMLPLKDDPGHQILAPVWNLYGSTDYQVRFRDRDGEWVELDSRQDEAEQSEEQREYYKYTVPYISINAIDGSVIYSN